MADPMRIRAQASGGNATVRVLMAHEMETGQRKDEKGKTLPTHYIQTFTVTHNGQALIDGQLNTSVSKNPLFAFKARNIKPGDKLSVSWKDNMGDKRQDEVIVT